MESRKHLIRLDDNYVSMAIDSLDSFNDVSEYDFSFLDKVLPHCTKHQLSHIEECTKRVDLSSITDKLWKGFFKRLWRKSHGGDDGDDEEQEGEVQMVGGLQSQGEEFGGRREREMGLKMKRMYEGEDASKLSRQVRVLDNVIPASSYNKKSIGVIKKEGKKKNSLMGKIKKQYDNSLEKKNLDFTNMKRSQVFKLCSDFK